MCDLIDLNSPDRKDLLISRLASPLIPAPTDTLSNNCTTQTNMLSSLITGKRDSLENNPFDMVLHKTTEYIQKKDDPFEVTLEKALKSKCKKSTSLKTSSLDLPDDGVFEQKTHRQKLQMNKTLDEFLIKDELNQKHINTNKTSNNSPVLDLNNMDTLSDNLKSNNVIPKIDVQDVDLSILNQSVMNDTLFEANKESNIEHTNTNLQSITLKCIEKQKLNTEQVSFSNAALKVPKFRRSLSQGETVSPKKMQYLNQRSLVEPLRISSDSESNISSSNSFYQLNEAFLKTRSSGSSVFSSLSNISSIPKLNSLSSTFNSPMMVSSDTMNRTFLESCSSEKSESMKLNENMNLEKERKSVGSAIKDSKTSIVSVSTKIALSDLTDRFNKLKTKISETHIPKNSINNKDEHTYSPSNDIKKCDTVMEKDNKCDINNKLLDIDIFTPENNCSKEHCTGSISDTSSDSVFLEGNKINKSIRQEAKLLAKTFEELALKTSSGSSIDDLITNNPSWTLELLPAFDDEASVENLIELPISPNGNNTKSKDVKVTEYKDNDSPANKKEDIINKVKEDIKNLEMELVNPISTEKRLTAATLLLDLKKLVKTENNVEAIKLLENLEIALGVNCDNNIELLTTYLNATNNLAKSPQKSGNSLEIIKNVSANNMEHSQEDNLTGDSTESIKESLFFENINLNEVSSNKCIDNQKYLNNVNSESKCEILDADIKTEKLCKKKVENDVDAQNVSKEDVSCKKENSNLLNGKMVIELLANIGKLLSEQTEEHSTLDILKNLGNVLNYASNNYKIDNSMKNDNNYIEIQQTPRKSKLKYEKKAHTSLLSKSAIRFSLDLEPKQKQPIAKNFIRRSISVSQTPRIKNESNSLISTSKSTSQLKEVTKRFPSDPGLVSPVSNKKIITSNNKNELQKDTQPKTIPIIELQKEKMSVINTVKNKFKKKIGGELVNRRGPMKAVLPIGSMQKKETISKKITSSAGAITPPHPHKIISSTPNSMTNGLTVKKSRSSKPVASSTPDAQNSKMRKPQSQVTISPKKRNFSCDISPVTTRVNVNNSRVNNSPQRTSKLTSPKKTTPKRRPTESGIPKSQTPPVSKRLNSSFDVNQCERLYESPQRTLHRTSNSQKNSPVSLKKNGNMQLSPLKDSNKFINKVKPINLISKLRRHTVNNIMEKENNYI